MSAYISALAKAFLFSAFFCSTGVMYSVLAKDLPEAKGPFFYKADKEGKSLYLLGTMHVENLDQLQCRSPIMSFLEDSDLLFTESNAEMAAQVMNELLFDMSKSSDYKFNELSENSKKFLVDMLKSNVQKPYSEEEYIKALQQFNAEYTALIITGSCLLSDENLMSLQSSSLQKIMDFEIQQISDSLSIPQDVLDDVKEIRNAHSFIIPFQNQQLTTKNINLIIDDYDQLCKIVTDIVQPSSQLLPIMQDLYRTGELDESVVENLIKSEYQRGNFSFSFLGESVPKARSLKAFKDILLKKRNQKWIEKIRQSYESNDSVFIAAGLGHLISSDNILDMLREDDFSIQRMDADCSFNSAL